MHEEAEREREKDDVQSGMESKKRGRRGRLSLVTLEGICEKALWGGRKDGGEEGRKSVWEESGRIGRKKRELGHTSSTRKKVMRQERGNRAEEVSIDRIERPRKQRREDEQS